MEAEWTEAPKKWLKHRLSELQTEGIPSSIQSFVQSHPHGRRKVNSWGSPLLPPSVPPPPFKFQHPQQTRLSRRKLVSRLRLDLEMHEVPLLSPAGFSVHRPLPSCSGWASSCWEEGPGHRQPKLTAPPRETPEEGDIYNALGCPVWVMPSPLSLVSVATLNHVTRAMARSHGILRLWLHWDGVTWAVGESL